MTTDPEIVNQPSLHHALKESRRETDSRVARALIDKAAAGGGLTIEETAVLLAHDDADTRAALWESAAALRKSAAGRSVSLFAPLHISNYCCNECAYCAFRARHRDQPRRALDRSQIAAEARAVAATGHQRAVLVCGAVYPEGQGFEYVLDAIQTIDGTLYDRGEIREIVVNVPPLETGDYRRLRDAGIAGYQLAQETYHRETYQTVHLGGPKRDYEHRMRAVHRAREAGIASTGIGVLAGLYDWRFEVLGLVAHARSLERDFGAGPGTISLSRLEAAPGSDFSEHAPHSVSDGDFLRMIAILRLALPRTGQILAHEEPAALRAEALRLGITEISAASRCEPGGYTAGAVDPQTQLGDHRPLDAVVAELMALDFIPSFVSAAAGPLAASPLSGVR